MRTHYDTLGVSKEASHDQIKQAYRALSKKYHPDINGGSKEAEKHFLEVQEAYTVLKNPASRESYDDQLKKTPQRDVGSNAEFTSSKNSTDKKQAFNINDLDRSFEHFFGFNPKTKEMPSSSPKGKKNPLDMTDLFERFFNK